MKNVPIIRLFFAFPVQGPQEILSTVHFQEFSANVKVPVDRIC